MVRVRAICYNDPMPHAQDTNIELSVVLPCLDEERTVAQCVRDARASLERNGIRGEVIVADNGSTDRSAELAELAGARVVPVARRGYGSALTGGIAEALGTYVVMVDADGSYAFDHLPRYMEKLREGYDLVMGNRFLGGVAKDAMPFSHRLGNPILSGLGRLFFHAPIRDFHCGMRGFSREAFKRMKLQTHGMEFASEMVVKATLLGMRITEVPTTLKKDGRNRPPHLKTWRDGWRHLRFMLLFCPRWLLLYPGLTILCAGLLLTGWTLFTVQPSAFLSLLALALSIVGMETIGFWDVSQAFAFGAGLHPHDPRRRMLRSLSRLETALLLGGTLLAAGTTGIVSAILQPDDTIAVGIASLTIFILGVQFILSSVLIGIIRIQRRSDLPDR